jgi:hypothetical protein
VHLERADRHDAQAQAARGPRDLSQQQEHVALLGIVSDPQRGDSRLLGEPAEIGQLGGAVSGLQCDVYLHATSGNCSANV